MFCDKCGAQISDDSVFCESCGARVGEAHVQEEPTQVYHEPTPSPKPVKDKAPGKGKPKLGLIIALAAIALVVIGVVVWVITMFPLKVNAEAAGNLVTTTGKFEKLGLTVKANQPILDIKYALDPDSEEPEAFTELKSGFSFGKKSVTIDELPVIPGENQLKLYVKTLFGKGYAEIKLISDLGYTSPPDMDALIETAEGEKVVSNELIVRFSESASESAIDSLISSYDGETVGRIYYLGEYQVKFKSSGLSYINDIMTRLSRESIVEDVFYNMYYEEERELIPNDPEYDSWDVYTPDGNNWGLEAIDAPGAWEYGDRIGSAKVGVIDTWLQYDHEDINVPLRHTYVLETDDFSDMEDIRDYFNEHDDSHVCPSGYCMYCAMHDHGTHCSGIIAANGDNSKGVSGVFWNAELYFATWWYLYGDSRGNVENSSTTTSMLYNITRLVSSGCRVLSISVGSAYPSEVTDYELSETERFENMIRSLEEKGYDFLIFKAAGNENDDASNYALNRIMTGGEHAKKHVMIVGSAESGLSVIDRDESWSGHTEKVFNMAPYSNYGDMIDICAPGSDILSTAPMNDYMNMSGTSMATPMAAGVAGLVYGANPGLRCDEVRNILLVSSRFHVIRDFEVYPMVNAKLAVELALQSTPVDPYVEPELGFITGMVQDARTLELIPNAAVLATNMDTGVEYEASVSNGVYSICLEPGLYKMSFSARGYITETIYKIQITAEEVQYSILLNLIPKATEKGVAAGHVVDAFDAYYISDADLTVYRGLNNTTGTPVATTTSDNYGEYTLSLDPGNYTVVASADGYMDGYANITIVSGETRDEQDIIITPILDEGEVRIVLTWGAEPADLDAHMVITALDDYEELYKVYHIYWYYRRYQVDSETYASLDVDDTSGYGPETISIYTSEEGYTYTYLVHSYTNRYDSDTMALARSGAVVKVYMAGLTEPIIFNVPYMEGNLWAVFNITNGVITPINEISYHESPSTVGDA